MWWVIGAGMLPVGLAAAWVLFWRPVRQVIVQARFDRARAQFHHQREWLEARFLTGLARLDPVERRRWDDARWQDKVVWARDRQTRRLLALIGVEFPAPFFPILPMAHPRHATALFEYHQGRWQAEGKRLDAIEPDEAFLRHRRFEPLVVPHGPARANP